MKVLKGSALVVILAILVVVGVAFAGLTLSGVLESETFDNIKEKIDILPEEEISVGSIQDLLGMDTALRCTYVQNEDGLDAEGVIYVTEDNVRTEMNINENSEDPAARMDMIIAGDWVYVWTSYQGSAMKAERSVLEGGEDFDALADIGSLEEELDMVCLPWIVDSSKFDVPDMEFLDITEMLEGFEGYSQEELMEMAEEESNEARKFLCDLCLTAPTQAEIDQCLIDAECDKL